MTELSNMPPPPENETIEPKSSSPWVMLTSMLLLISLLILSSAMLVHYAMSGKEGGTEKSAFSFAKFLEQGRALTARPEPKAEAPKLENMPVAADTSPTESGMKKFFSRVRQSTIHWPNLKLSGFGKGSDGQSDFAIINGEHVRVNTPIDGAILVEILNQGVVVEYKGERKTLTVELSR